jgi:hypothetical protein
VSDSAKTEAESQAADGMAPPDIPSFWAYMPATVEALQARGGSATIQELLEDVPGRMGLTEAQRAVPHDTENDGQTEVAYRLAWARTYLKKAGLIHSPSRATWALTPEGFEARNVDGRSIARQIRAESPKTPLEAPAEEAETYLFAWNPERFEWRDLDDQIRAVQETGAADDTWSCGSVRSIPPGSRFFLIRLGQEPRGIVGAGVTVDEVYEAPHYQEERAARGETKSPTPKTRWTPRSIGSSSMNARPVTRIGSARTGGAVIANAETNAVRKN